MTGRSLPFEIIGHRGCEGLALENSIDAMKRAIDLHVDRVEFDVNLTSDRELILFHDKSLLIGSTYRRISRVSYAALLKAKKMNDKEIPRFWDVLEICRNKIKIQAEIKARGIETKMQEEIIRSAYPGADLSISSFDFRQLKKMKALFPDLEPFQFVYLYGGTNPKQAVLKKMKAHGIGTISIKAKHATKDKVKLFQDDGMRVISYGLGDRLLTKTAAGRIYKQMMDLGLDGFTSAFPDIALEIRSTWIKSS
ncbi:MAG: glycerophosphodiester phosphodiesterase [Promethearchaeota archaeon]